MFGFPPAQHFTPTRWLHDGDTVQIGNETLNVRHCPGHTPGHVVFHAPQIDRAFVGDVLFAGSIGRTDFPQGNHQQLIDSITQRLWPMGDPDGVHPGPRAGEHYERMPTHSSESFSVWPVTPACQRRFPIHAPN
jgi:glyoxylase-like metal-dependent hydrolase (beta-lactamase superfamily II)